jgi:hypothetical protein
MSARLAAVTLVVSAGACAQAPAPAGPNGAPATTAASVIAFRPEARLLASGDSAISELVVRNVSGAARTFWIGYSVRDSIGEWHDVPAASLELAPDAEGGAALSWHVPRASLPGPYVVVMAVWSAPPGPNAERLAVVERADAFRVAPDPELSSEERDRPWFAGGQRLGRGRMRPEQVRAADGGFTLTLLGGRCDGAEIRSRERVGFGRYHARMRTPLAPGSLSAFFLYADVPGGNDEIDIEVFNDGSRRVLLTGWVAGVQARTDTVELSFDPHEGPHDYGIDWTASELAFSADGQPLARWTEGFPRDPMRLMANVWWPSWLPCAPPDGDRSLVIEEIGRRVPPSG